MIRSNKFTAPALIGAFLVTGLTALSPNAALAGADGRKNTTIALGAAAAWELLHHQTLAGLALGAGTVYAEKKYEDSRRSERDQRNRRYYDYGNNRYGNNNHNNDPYYNGSNNRDNGSYNNGYNNRDNNGNSNYNNGYDNNNGQEYDRDDSSNNNRNGRGNDNQNQSQYDNGSYYGSDGEQYHYLGDNARAFHRTKHDRGERK